MGSTTAGDKCKQLLVLPFAATTYRPVTVTDRKCWISFHVHILYLSLQGAVLLCVLDRRLITGCWLCCFTERSILSRYCSLVDGVLTSYHCSGAPGAKPLSSTKEIPA